MTRASPSGAVLFIDMPRPKRSPLAVKEGMMNLKLRQNAFVGGDFTPEGTIVSFTEQEAKRRLSTTQLWDVA